MLTAILKHTKVLSALRRGGWLVMLLALLLSQSPLVAASGLSDPQRKLLQEHINNFNIAACSAPAATPGAGNGVPFDDSQSADTGNQTTVDDDGIDPSPTGSPYHQGHTSYADGQLGALHTNYIALSPGWASANGLVLGDVAALTYNGNTIYAVYGDNGAGSAPHAEISVKADLALKGITDPTKADNISGVHFVVYPGTSSQLAGSVDQSKIDQIGAAASGGAAAGAGGAGSCCAGAAASFGPGTLPSSVPDPYNSIFTAAATKAGIEPALLAGIFYGGEHGNSFPDPPPPYGHGGPWASSGTPSPGSPDWPSQPPGPGAAGPFQFEYPTWQRYGVSASGTGGPPDVEDLIDAAFGAANYLAASGAKNTTDPAKIQQAILAYNHSSSYVSSVMAAYQKFGGGGAAPPPGGAAAGTPAAGCPAAGATAGFTNPFPGGWEPNRLDMGYDGTFKGQIVAPFAGTVTFAADSFSNWGGYMELKADTTISGLPVSVLYFAEGIKPVVTSGHVDAGTPIADPVPSPWNGISGNIEWGLAKDGPGWPTDTYVFGQCGSSGAQSAVLGFSQWAQNTLKVAPPSETDHAGCP
jgi:hypothetical protein